MTSLHWITQFLEVLTALAAAPLFMGWINQCRAWLQNKSAPSILLPYRGLRKLFHKDVVLATHASALFRIAPYVVFGAMVCAAAVIPSLGTRLPFSGFLAEPALLMVIFLASLIAASTALPAISEGMVTRTLALYPSLAFTGVAFLLVLLAENARIPVDNPATHLELTMIHEAMLLEYSGRHLALMEWAAALKLLNYACIGFALFLPWGLATGDTPTPVAMVASVPILGVKLLAAGAVLAFIETVSAKLRIFRAPEFLATAFLFAVLGLLVHLLLGA
jgi:formate hydrogenlyase subunit 4